MSKFVEKGHWFESNKRTRILFKFSRHGQRSGERVYILQTSRLFAPKNPTIHRRVRRFQCSIVTSPIAISLIHSFVVTVIGRVKGNFHNNVKIMTR